MNPIFLNLLVEEQLAEQASARDPLRTAVSIAGVIVVLAVGAGVGVSWWVGGVKRQAEQLQAQREKLVKGGSSEGPSDLRSWKSFADDIVAMNQSRTLIAPQLALLKELVPGTIQLNRFNVNLSAEAAAAMQTIQPGDKGGGSRRPARAVNVERVTLQMEGKAEALQPELEVQKFIGTLKEHPQLKTAIESVELRSISREVSGPMVPGEVRTAIARFVIECRYREKQ
jgi:hypothetical protein